MRRSSERQPGPVRSGPARPPVRPGMTPAQAELFALQRSLGNSATTAMLAGLPVVQRDVGFEFETTLETLAVQPGLAGKERDGSSPLKEFRTRDQWEPRRQNAGADSHNFGRGMHKTERLVEVPGRFTMEADETSGGGSDLEFVTSPFPETDEGLAQLREAMDGIVRVAGGLGQSPVTSAGTAARIAGGRARRPADQPPGQRIRNAFQRGEYAIKAYGPDITANPQTTVGVRLDRVADLFQEMVPGPGGHQPGDLSNDLANQDISRQGPVIPAVQTGVDAALQGFVLPGSQQPASAELRGLLTLIAGYLVGGARSGGQSYAKGLAPVLARTDFASMFDRLPPAEVTELRAAPQAFVNLALDCAGLAPADAAQPVLAGTLGLTRRPGIAHITRAIWLTQMVNGVDVMSSAGHDQYPWAGPNDAAQGPELESMGAMGNRTDPAGPDPMRGPIVELRRMRKRVPYTEWAGMADAVFQMIRRINN